MPPKSTLENKNFNSTENQIPAKAKLQKVQTRSQTQTAQIHQTDMISEFMNESSLKKQINKIDDPLQTQVKVEGTDPCHLSDHDLSEMLLTHQIKSPSNEEVQQGNKVQAQLKSKSKNKIIRKRKRTDSKTPVKIEDGSQNMKNKRIRRKKIQIGPERKIRTTVNQEKIKIMEYLFPLIVSNTPYKGTILSLKDVAKIVDLGYSTILHKFKDYRSKGEIEKGLLLKCKDIKRKYNKSLILQNYIKQALKQGQFKTAMELATFITRRFGFRANRSIISRHLNEMQRDESKRLGHIKLDDSDDEEEQKVHQQKEIPAPSVLNEFSSLFMNLRSMSVDFNYFTVIRLYLVEGKVLLDLQKEEVDFKMVNLVIMSTDKELTEYYPCLVSQTQVFLASSLSSLNPLAYKALYNQLESKVLDDYLNIDISCDAQKVYVIYPFKDTQLEYRYREKIIQQFLDKKINIITYPPKLKTGSLNFIQKWFEGKIMIELQKERFGDFNKFKDYLLPLMNHEQTSLRHYSNLMISNLKYI